MCLHKTFPVDHLLVILEGWNLRQVTLLWRSKKERDAAASTWWGEAMVLDCPEIWLQVPKKQTCGITWRELTRNLFQKKTKRGRTSWWRSPKYELTARTVHNPLLSRTTSALIIACSLQLSQGNTIDDAFNFSFEPGGLLEQTMRCCSFSKKLQSGKKLQYTLKSRHYMENNMEKTWVWVPLIWCKVSMDIYLQNSR